MEDCIRLEPQLVCSDEPEGDQEEDADDAYSSAKLSLVRLIRLESEVDLLAKHVETAEERATLWFIQ